MPILILLIRHGETAWNREGRIQGQRDIPLSPRGEDQARLLSARLRNVALDAVFSSDSLRSRRTAEIALEGRSLPLLLSSGWRERDYGEWEGKTWTELHQHSAAEAERFDQDPVDFTPPGGETWNQMQSRVFNELQQVVAAASGRTVGIFTHGGPCKAAVFAALGLPPAHWRNWVSDNASIQKLIWDGALIARRRSPWKLAGFNDTAHLQESDKIGDPSAPIHSDKVV